MPESGKLPEIVVSVVCMQTVYMWPKSRKEVRHYREHWVLCVPSWRECDVWFRIYALSVNHSTLQVGASVTIPTTSRSIGNYPYPPFIPQGQVKSVKSNVSRSPWTSKDCWSIAQRCFRAVFIQWVATMWWRWWGGRWVMIVVRLCEILLRWDSDF